MPEGYFYETQIIVSVLSIDQTMSSDVIGIVAASAAMAVSDIPGSGLLAGVRIGRVNGQFVVNPDKKAQEVSELNLVVAGTKDAVMMVEAGADGLSEDTMIDAIELAHREIQKIVAKIEELQAKAGKAKRVLPVEAIEPEIEQAVRKVAAEPICEAMYIPAKRSAKIGSSKSVKKRLRRLLGRMPSEKPRLRKCLPTWNIPKSGG